jgi:hypothetical protein
MVLWMILKMKLWLKSEAFDVAADEFGKTKLATPLVEKKVSRKK